ncbi:MAG TPA: hypothetical protein VE377_04190 [Candidatus Dormibacteraeota bacterium]|nr:hypothetical protein [Candidatus Dormibacteraeota bacterium]
MPRHHERGYVLLTLLLIMAILAIAVGIAASSIAFSIRRDREEELIHRGVQYTRAIREFSKKTGHFPLRMEELDNTGGRRFLRKHYKDPVTGRDFKLVYMSEVQLSGNIRAAIAGSTNGAPGLNAATPPPSNGDPATPPQTPGASTDPQSDSFSTSGPTIPQGGGGSSNTPFSSPQPISGGLIVGVVSTSKDQTIRQFNGKNHYNQWRFYYDTAFDRYFLMNAPTERPLFQPQPRLEGAETPGQSISPPSQQPPTTTPTPASQQ